MIKQMWTAGDKKENENTTVIKNSLPSTAISDSSTLPFGLIKTLVGGISIKNEGQVDVISQDKVNVRLINSPIHINFTY